MVNDRLVIPLRVYEEMLAHARAEAPLECCGFLAGLDRPEQVIPLINRLQSPVAYEADPASLIRAHREMRSQGWHELAIYHSHPTSPAIPSRTDLQRNGYGTGIVHVIISLAEGQNSIRGWRFDPDEFYEVCLIVEET
jgi:proteasome lid subunit RPN8/RPN11